MTVASGGAVYVAECPFFDQPYVAAAETLFGETGVARIGDAFALFAKEFSQYRAFGSRYVSVERQSVLGIRS